MLQFPFPTFLSILMIRIQLSQSLEETTEDWDNEMTLWLEEIIN